MPCLQGETAIYEAVARLVITAMQFFR